MVEQINFEGIRGELEAKNYFQRQSKYHLSKMSVEVFMAELETENTNIPRKFLVNLHQNDRRHKQLYLDLVTQDIAIGTIFAPNQST